MPSIINVLIESFQLLRKRPRLFVPKLVSTVIGAAWLVGLVSGTGSIYLYAATAPFLVVLAVFVSVMTASMVRNIDSERILGKGLNEAWDRIAQLLVSSAVLFVLAFLVYIPAGVGAVVYVVYGYYMALVAGGVITLLLVFLLAFLVYFFPISLLEEGSVTQGFQGSARMSVSNSLEVTFLTLVSFALLAAASMAGDQGMRYFGYAGFFALRMISGVVTTYVFVVSPKYYLS